MLVVFPSDPWQDLAEEGVHLHNLVRLRGLTIREQYDLPWDVDNTEETIAVKILLSNRNYTEDMGNKTQREFTYNYFYNIMYYFSFYNSRSLPGHGGDSVPKRRRIVRLGQMYFYYF